MVVIMLSQTLTANQATSNDVIITANYKGVTTFVNVSVAASTIDISTDSTIGISGISNQIYTGSTFVPVITISRSGSALTLNNDYEVTYTNSTNAGTASISINGKGNYAGTVNKTFNITAKSIESVSVDSISDVWYTGAELLLAKQKSIDLTWDKVSCANGYEIYRYNDSKKKYVKIGTSSQRNLNKQQ